MENPYQLTTWERPPYYGGFSPEGDFLVFSKTRDSDLITQCNWDIMIEEFDRLNHEFGSQWVENQEIESGQERFAYTFVARHWAVGWVEYLLLRQDSPEEFQRVANDFLAALANYPVLDDTRMSEMEWEEARKWWEHAGYRERIDAYERMRPAESLFSVRREEVPDWAVEYCQSL